MDNNWKKEFNDETEKQKVYTLIECQVKEFYDLDLKGKCWVKIPAALAKAVGYSTGDTVRAVIPSQTYREPPLIWRTAHIEVVGG